MKGKPWNLICASSCRLREEGSKFLILLSEGGSYLVIDLLAEGYVMFFLSKICTCSDMCKNSVLCFVSFISWTRQLSGNDNHEHGIVSSMAQN